MEASFCYADLAGHLTLSAATGHEFGADTVVRFMEMLDSALGDGDRLIRSIGDAAVIACTEPHAAVLFVSALHECLAAEPGFPRLRVGMHHGDAAHDGEPVGPALELSALIAARARPGEALATRAVACAAASMGIEIVNQGDFAFGCLRQPVTIFALDVVAAEGERVEDPVCRIEIERERAPARLRHNRVDYYFCSLECAGYFARDPTRFAFD